MSIDDEVQKAKQAAQRLNIGLQEEQSWASKHPSWMTSIAAGIFLALIVAIVKGCH